MFDQILGIIVEKNLIPDKKPNPIGTYSKSQTKPFYVGTKEAPSK